MSALVRYKNPTEYSFRLWIRNYPESTHPLDRERFLKFVRNVCAFNSRKWKDINFLERQILKEKPYFDRESLNEILIVFEYLIDFYKTPPTKTLVIEDIEVTRGYFVECGFKDDDFYQKELPKEKFKNNS